MKRAYVYMLITAVALLCCSLSDLNAQEKKSNGDTDKLSAEEIKRDGQELDAQIVELCRKIENVVRNYDLMKTRSIRILPYQISYRLTDRYIEMERHELVQDFILKKVSKLKTKKIRLYSSGQSLSKIESEIYEKDYNAECSLKVVIVDNSPTASGTDDIVFTQSFNKRVTIENKKMGEIKNTTAFPVRNDIKRDFLVPHLTYFYNTILNIAETYRKSIKDSDSMMYEFLKKSTQY